MNALSVAMFMGTPEIVEMLLDRGFDPMLSDVAGNHPFLFACISNRVDNVKFWLKRFPEWDLEKPNRVFGGVALGCAVYMGPNRFELTELLLKRGAKYRHSIYWIRYASSLLHVQMKMRILEVCETNFF